MPLSPPDSGRWLKRLVASPSIMTWVNLTVRSLGMFVLLPVVLAVASPAEAVVWLLLSNWPLIVTIADFGFLPNFSRLVAYSTAARSSDAQRVIDIQKEAAAIPLPQVASAMAFVYTRLALITVGVLLVLGYFALRSPNSAVGSPVLAWAASASVLVGSVASVFGNQYVAFLTGTERIAETQAALGATGLAGVLCGLIVMGMGASPFHAMIAQQVWVIVGVAMSARMATAAGLQRARQMVTGAVDRNVLETVYSNAWRSGVAATLTVGGLQFSNLIVAQLPDRAASASYLLGLRVVQAVSQFSQAPFYTRLPRMSRLHIEGKEAEKLEVAAKAMRASHWAFALAFIGVGLAMKTALTAIGSNVRFADPLVWAVLGLAFFGERYGAMHVQLYSTSNHILWHVAALKQFLAFAVIGTVLFAVFGLVGIPLALLVANWAFYAAYCARLSYGQIGRGAAHFERYVLLPPLGFAIVYAVASVLWAIT